MTEFLMDYGLFLLETITVVAALLVVIGFAASAGRKGSDEGLEVEKLNDRFESMASALKSVVLTKSALKKEAKDKKAAVKAADNDEPRPRSYIIDFKGDLKASAVASLREEVSAILDVAESSDEVIVKIENPGGVVHEHGLAASQLARIRDREIPLIVCVDKVAASGGYLMACVANSIHAAPFAILGSIGVLAQIPNFHRLLDGHGVEFEQVTAGKHKRTVTMFGENTDADRKKLKEELEDVHALFKAAVQKYRPNLDLEKVATGEHWYGTRAIDLGLADALTTSDALLAERAADRDLYAVTYKIKQPLQKRLLGGVDALLNKFDATRWQRKFDARLPR